MTENMSESEWEYSAELWKAVYADVFNVLKALSELVSHQKEILQIQWQVTSLITEAQAAAFFKEVYEECYRIFKEQVTQSDLSFIKRV